MWRRLCEEALLARDEIYKIYMLLHRSDLNISEMFRQFVSHFLAKFYFCWDPLHSDRDMVASQ